MKRALALSPLALVSLLLVNCGGGAAGKSVQPKDPTAKNALDPASTIKECKPAPGTPLVVDLKSNERSDFELAMQDGVAVVAYNCKELRLLKSCTLQGVKYKFQSVTVKEDVVQLATKDEVMANIPISGAKLSANLESGSTLELALITVGKKHYKQPIYHDDLKGDCDGATHVVRGAYIGAFAMGTGTVGQASAVADLFGAGGGGASVSKKRATTKDGDLGACRGMERGADHPPDACQAITRLDLNPIRAGANPDKDKVANGGPGTGTPPPTDPAIPDAIPTEEPAPPPSDALATSSKSVTSRPGGKKRPPTKTSTKKPGSASASASSPTSSSLHAATPAMASAAKAESAEVEETPSCPEGFKWNGVICKQQ